MQFQCNLHRKFSELQKVLYLLYSMWLQCSVWEENRIVVS